MKRKTATALCALLLGLMSVAAAATFDATTAHSAPEDETGALYWNVSEFGIDGALNIIDSSFAPGSAVYIGANEVESVTGR